MKPAVSIYVGARALEEGRGGVADRFGTHNEAEGPPAGKAAAKPRRRSVRYLYASLSITTVVLIMGSLAMLNLFGSAAETPPPVEAEGPRLVIAVARTTGGSFEWATYADAVAQMRNDTGLDLQIRFVPDRNAVIDLMANDEVDAAFLCTYCYLSLEQSRVVDVVARPLIDYSARDAAVLVVRGESSYERLRDLEGQSVAVSRPTSLAGSAFLFWLVRDHGVDAPSFFSEIVRDSSQERNLASLAAGRVEATVVNRSQLAGWAASGFRVIESSPEYGTPPFVVRRDLDAEARTLLESALLRVRIAPAESSVTGFVPASAADYEFAHELLPYAGELGSIDEGSDEE
jgi:phosphonate transport system substrate-binding protein